MDSKALFRVCGICVLASSSVWAQVVDISSDDHDITYTGGTGTMPLLVASSDFVKAIEFELHFNSSEMRIGSMDLITESSLALDQLDVAIESTHVRVALVFSGRGVHFREPRRLFEFTYGIRDIDELRGQRTVITIGPEGPVLTEIRIVEGDGFIRGDANIDGTVGISDVMTILSGLFMSGPQPICRASWDLDANDVLSITDAIYILRRLFIGAPPPPAPSSECGVLEDEFCPAGVGICAGALI